MDVEQIIIKGNRIPTAKERKIAWRFKDMDEGDTMVVELSLYKKMYDAAVRYSLITPQWRFRMRTIIHEDKKMAACQRCKDDPESEIPEWLTPDREEVLNAARAVKEGNVRKISIKWKENYPETSYKSAFFYCTRILIGLANRGFIKYRIEEGKRIYFV